MATIRASCDDCGDVELTTQDVQVRICEDTEQGTYGFRCPVCQMMVAKAAETRTIDLLVASGVSCVTWALPAELHERPVDGEPLSHDDLLDFHHALRDDEAMARELSWIADQ